MLMRNGKLYCLVRISILSYFALLFVDSAHERQDVFVDTVLCTCGMAINSGVSPELELLF